MREVLLNLSDFLGGGGEGRAAEKPARPPMVVQRVGLLERFAAAAVPSEPLQPGDLVVSKPGLPLLDGVQDHMRAQIVWRRLDPDNAADLAIIKTAVERNPTDLPDIVVMCASDSGLSYQTAAVASHHYRRLDATERAELDALLAMDGDAAEPASPSDEVLP